MVYCVVPRGLEDELYERLSAYYAGDPEVEVIVDRRTSERRQRGRPDDDVRQRREVRDRRRRRAVGEFPALFAEPSRGR